MMFRTLAAMLCLVFVPLAGADTSSVLLIKGGRILSEESPPGEESTMPHGGPSPGKVFLLSALVPGAGQLTMGQKRGWLFLAADVAVWAGYLSMRGAGKDAEDEYATFAQQHYTLTNPDFTNDAERGWLEWWDLFRRLDPEYMYADSVYWQYIEDDYEHSKSSYYQEIAESNGYIYGWDDWAPDPSGNNDEYWGFDSDSGGLYFNYISEHRDEFRSLRKDASDKMAWASRLVGAAVALRAVSAIDALRSARSAREQGGLQLEVSWHQREPALVLSWKRPWG